MLRISEDGAGAVLCNDDDATNLKHGAAGPTPAFGSLPCSGAMPSAELKENW